MQTASVRLKDEDNGPEEQQAVCSSSADRADSKVPVLPTPLPASNITALAAASAPPFKKLRGDDNWEDWRMLMELHLGNLFPCTLRDPPPEAMSNRESAEFQRDLQARTRILFAMEESLLRYVRGANTAHQVWSRLCEVFNDKVRVKRIGLLKRLVGLRQRATLSAYVAEFRDLLNQIADTGLEIDDMVAAVMLTANVKEEHRGLCDVLERTCVLQRQDGSLTIPFNEVCEALLRDAPNWPPGPAHPVNEDRADRDRASASDLEEKRKADPGRDRSREERPSDPRLKKHADPAYEEQQPCTFYEEEHPDHSYMEPYPNTTYGERTPKSPFREYREQKSKRERSPPYNFPRRDIYPRCSYCKKTNHPEYKCHFKNRYSNKNVQGTKGTKKWSLPVPSSQGSPVKKEKKQ